MDPPDLVLADDDEALQDDFQLGGAVEGGGFDAGDVEGVEDLEKGLVELGEEVSGLGWWGWWHLFVCFFYVFFFGGWVGGLRGRWGPGGGGAWLLGASLVEEDEMGLCGVEEMDLTGWG